MHECSEFQQPGNLRIMTSPKPDPKKAAPMKPQSILFVLAVVTTAAIAAESLPASHPPVDARRQGHGAREAQLPHKGEVLSAIDVPQYTYLEVIQNKKILWIASSTVAAKKGDKIQFDEGMAMTNFHSKTLNRTFPSISFVKNVVVAKEKK